MTEGHTNRFPSFDLHFTLFLARKEDGETVKRPYRRGPNDRRSRRGDRPRGRGRSSSAWTGPTGVGRAWGRESSRSRDSQVCVSWRVNSGVISVLNPRVLTKTTMQCATDQEPTVRKAPRTQVWEKETSRWEGPIYGDTGVEVSGRCT